MATTTHLSPEEDLKREISKAGFTMPVVDATSENQPLLSRYKISAQAFINATNELIDRASAIKEIPAILSKKPTIKLNCYLWQVQNILTDAFEIFKELKFISPKSYFKETEKSLEETKQTLANIQSKAEATQTELVTLQSSVLLKDQKIENFDNSIKSMIQMIDLNIFHDATPLPEDQKNQAMVKSMEQIVTYLKQNYPAYVPAQSI